MVTELDRQHVAPGPALGHVAGVGQRPARKDAAGRQCRMLRKSRLDDVVMTVRQTVAH
jgi:hypothetical protein